MVVVFLLLLDEQVEHLCLNELSDKVPVLLGLHSFEEALFLECSQLFVSSLMLDMICKMSNSFHEKADEGFRHHAVHLLCSYRTQHVTHTLYTEQKESVISCDTQ